MAAQASRRSACVGGRRTQLPVQIVVARRRGDWICNRAVDFATHSRSDCTGIRRDVLQNHCLVSAQGLGILLPPANGSGPPACRESDSGMEAQALADVKKKPAERGEPFTTL